MAECRREGPNRRLASPAPVRQRAPVPEEAQIVLWVREQRSDSGAHAPRIPREQIQRIVGTDACDAALRRDACMPLQTRR